MPFWILKTPCIPDWLFAKNCANGMCFLLATALSYSEKDVKGAGLFFFHPEKELRCELLPTNSPILMSAGALFIGVETWILLIGSSPQQGSCSFRVPVLSSLGRRAPSVLKDF